MKKEMKQSEQLFLKMGIWAGANNKEVPIIGTNAKVMPLLNMITKSGHVFYLDDGLTKTTICGLVVEEEARQTRGPIKCYRCRANYWKRTQKTGCSFGRKFLRKKKKRYLQ